MPGLCEKNWRDGVRGWVYPIFLVKRLRRGNPSNRGFQACGCFQAAFDGERAVGFRPAASRLTKKNEIHPRDVALRIPRLMTLVAARPQKIIYEKAPQGCCGTKSAERQTDERPENTQNPDRWKTDRTNPKSRPRTQMNRVPNRPKNAEPLQGAFTHEGPKSSVCDLNLFPRNCIYFSLKERLWR